MSSRASTYPARIALLLAWVCLGPVLAAEPAVMAGPFRFESSGSGPETVSTASIFRDGAPVPLESARGELASGALLLGAPEGKLAAAAVLWLDASNGREAKVRVYQLPDGRRVWESQGFLRAELLPGPMARLFTVASPLTLVELPPPRLRALRDFAWDGERVTAVGRRLEKAATPQQRLEAAADLLDTGEAAAALAALEGWDRELAGDAELSTEHALALDLMVRSQVRLKQVAGARATLERLVREHPDEPAGLAAQEALEFIRAHSGEAYLERESATPGR